MEPASREEEERRRDGGGMVNIFVRLFSSFASYTSSQALALAPEALSMGLYTTACRPVRSGQGFSTAEGHKGRPRVTGSSSTLGAMEKCYVRG